LYHLETQLETDPDFDVEREFDHALVSAGAKELLHILRSLKGVDPHQVPSDITRRREWIDKRRIFLTANGENASVVWTAAGDTDLLKRLSQHVSEPVKWVYADEPTRSWAYLEYKQGHLVESILDPQQTWESGTVSGEVLMGRGKRTYASLSEFLRCIQDRYTPPDMQWCYPAWVIAETREAYLSTPEVFAWAIEFVFELGGTRFAYHGPVPDELRAECE
jgi:hypothetical protein